MLFQVFEGTTVYASVGASADTFQSSQIQEYSKTSVKYYKFYVTIDLYHKKYVYYTLLVPDGFKNV